MTTANPCGLALLPAYFARRLGMDSMCVATRAATVARALKTGFMTSLGAVAVFALVGIVFSFGADWIIGAVPWAGLVVGIILTTVGVLVMAGKHINVSLPVLKSNATNPSSGLRGDVTYGVGYATVSLSCTLPILLTITGVSLSGSVVSSAMSFLAFALGVGTIFTGISVSAAFARNGLMNVLKRFLPYVYRVSGGFLFFAGAYVAYLWADALFELSGPERVILGTGERLSGMFRMWLDGPSVQWMLWFILGLLIVLSGWFLMRRKAENM